MAKIPLVQADNAIDLQPLRPVYQQDVSGSYSGVSANAQRSAIVGNALDKNNDLLYKDYMQWQNDDNERAAKDLDVQYADQVRQIQYGDGTANNPGYYGNSGQAALDSYGGSVQAVQMARQKMSDNISNPAVKKMFDSVSAQRASTAQGSMTEYSLQQRKVANLASSTARQQTFVGDAAAGAGDDATVVQALKGITSESYVQSGYAGSKPDSPEAKLKAAQDRGMALSAAIESVASDNPDRAVDLYNKYGKDVDPATQLKLYHATQEATMLGRAQNNADAILKQYGNDPESAQAAARAIKEPGLRKATLDEVRDQLQELRSNKAYQWQAQEHAITMQHQQDYLEERDALPRAQKNADDLTTEYTIEDPTKPGTYKFDLQGALSASHAMDQTPKEREMTDAQIKNNASVFDSVMDRQIRQQTLTENEVTRQINLKALQDKAALDATRTDWLKKIGDGATVIQLSKDDPEGTSRLTGQLGLMDDMRKAEQSHADGKQFSDTSDNTTLHSLTTLPYDQLAKLDPTTEKAKLTSSEFVTLQSAQLAAQRKVEAIQGNRSQYYKQGYDYLKSFAPVNMNWDSNSAKRSETTKQLQAAAEQKMDQYIDQVVSQGKQPDPTAMRQFAATTMLPIATPGRLYGSNSVGFGFDANNLTSDQRANAIVPIDQIPQEILNQIKDAFTSVGKKPSEDDIEALAGAYAVGDQQRLQKLLYGK